MLNYNSLEMSKTSAISTQRLTEKMEGMSAQAVKETMMMRVIAVLTILFLPGTFISVSQQALWTASANKSQTLMSTDIVKHDPDTRNLIIGRFSPGALWLYIALTLPLTTVTMLAYVAVYKRVSHAMRPARSN